LDGNIEYQIMFVGLNMRGKVDVEKFGKLTLQDYEQNILQYCKVKGNVSVQFYHSNIEGEIINKLYQTYETGEFHAAIFNPGGFTVGYRALGVAISQVKTKIPVIEVHLSNPASNGLVSEIAPHCLGVVTGFGVSGYRFALDALVSTLESRVTNS